MTHLRPLRLLLLLVLAGCASAPGGADELEAARKVAEKGDAKKARDILDSASQSYPNNLEIRFELARLEYEAGEVHHVKERVAMRTASELVEGNKRSEAVAKRREGTKHRGKALPHYESARKHLRYVVSNEEDDTRIAWASYLLMRCDVFFEDWEAAYDDIERAIRLGQPIGPRLLKWREYQTGLKEKLQRQGYGP